MEPPLHLEVREREGEREREGGREREEKERDEKEREGGKEGGSNVLNPQFSKTR